MPYTRHVAKLNAVRFGRQTNDEETTKNDRGKTVESKKYFFSVIIGKPDKAVGTAQL